MIKHFHNTTKPRWAAKVNPHHPLAKNLTAGFIFNGSGAGDISHYKHTGALSGAATYNITRDGYALSCGLNNADCLIVDDNKYLDGFAAMTIWMLVRNNKGSIAATGNETLVQKIGAGDDSYRILWTQTEDLSFEISVGATTTALTVVDGIPPGNGSDLSMVCGRYDGTTLYLDAYSPTYGLKSSTTPHATGGTVNSTAHNLYIGGDGANASWDGSILALYIFDKALSESDMKDLYASPYQIVAPRKIQMPLYLTATTFKPAWITNRSGIIGGI